MSLRIGGQWLTLKVETNKTEKLSPLHSHWEVEFPPLLAMSESESQVKSESESLIRNSLSSKCISQHWMLLEVPRMACCCWLMMSRIQIYRNRTSEFHLDANAFLDADKESFKDAVDHEEGKQKQSAWLSTVNQFSHSELCNLHIVSGPVSKLIQFTIQDMWYRPTTVLFVFRTRVQLSFKQINQEAGGSVISIKSLSKGMLTAVHSFKNCVWYVYETPHWARHVLLLVYVERLPPVCLQPTPSSLFAFFLISDHDAPA